MVQDTHFRAPGHWKGATFAGTALLLLIAAGGSALLFHRLSSPGVAFGPWQGVLLASGRDDVVPVFTRWAAGGLLSIGEGALLRRLNLLAVASGALASAFVALSAWAVARGPDRGDGPRRFDIEALAGGLAAASVFAFSPAVVHASTAAGPTALSAAVGIASLGALVAFVERRERTWLLALSALLAGLATANQPAFGLLLPVVMFGVLLSGTEGADAVGAFAMTLVLFAAGLLPVVWGALFSEAARDSLFAGAVTAPYPAISGMMPSADSLAHLASDYALPVLAAFGLGLFLLARPGRRRAGVSLALVLLLFGPLLPSLTNQHGQTDPYRDMASLRLLFVACLALGAGGGAVAMLRTLVPFDRFWWLRAGLVACLAAGIASVQANRIPNRNHHLAPQLAEAIARSCPEDSFLLSGDPEVTSLLLAADADKGLGRGLHVVPLRWLADPALRRELARERLATARVSSELGVFDNWERWQREQPVLLQRILEDCERSVCTHMSFAELAIWDFVLENHSAAPICFAGVRSSWLAARAQPRGAVLTYPHRGPRGSEAGDHLELWVETATRKNAHLRDPGLARSARALLLPLSDTMRRQGKTEEAVRWAELASLLDPAAPEPVLAVATALARDGRRNQTVDLVDNYMKLSLASFRVAPTAVLPQVMFMESVEDALTRHAQAEAFLEAARREKTVGALSPDRRATAARLWEMEELTVLQEGYGMVLSGNPDNLDVLYQNAAVLAQLGDLGRAMEALRRWVDSSGLSDAQLVRHIIEDGRFTLLRDFHGIEPAAGWDGSRQSAALRRPSSNQLSEEGP